MFKPSTLGTLSPMTTATTSSGYSTGDSSVSAAAVPSLKKSPSSSIGLKQQQQQQQQHRTKSKGKQKTSEKKKNKTHLVRGTRHAQAISLALLPMTFSIFLSLSRRHDDDLKTTALHLLIRDSILLSNENRQRSNYCTNLLLLMPLEEIIGLVLC
jgi:hypothetical protein